MIKGTQDIAPPRKCSATLPAHSSRRSPGGRCMAPASQEYVSQRRSLVYVVCRMSTRRGARSTRPLQMAGVVRYYSLSSGVCCLSSLSPPKPPHTQTHVTNPNKNKNKNNNDG